LSSILCLPKNDVFRAGLAREGYDRLVGEDVTKWVTLLNAHATYRDRDSVETDETFLQVIPYVEVRDRQTRAVATYRRCSSKSGEKRLDARRSLGFGGHVEFHTDWSEQASAAEVVTNAVIRELSEELSWEPEDPETGSSLESILKETTLRSAVRGLIYDPTNAVGRVHIGLHMLLLIPGGALTSQDETVADVQWWCRSKCVEARESFEGWSQYLIDAGQIPVDQLDY
jgi:predicted NUDIX family phosphoesterase